MRNILLAFLIVAGIFAAMLLIYGKNTQSHKDDKLSLFPTGGIPTPTTLNQASAATSSSPTIDISKLQIAHTSVIKTTKGEITIQLFPEAAPQTIDNFVKKAKSGYYANLTFHRVEDWVIQGGDPKGDGTGGAPMATELNNKPFVVGSVGVARGGDIRVSNDSQFFITKTEAHHLDGQYTNFGIVTAGMEVVNKIEVGDKILGIEVQ